MTDKYADLKPQFDRDLENGIGFWFPKVKDCGIPVPKTLLFDVPRELYQAFYMGHPTEDLAAVQAFVDNAIQPAMKAAGIGLPFIKNATFSNKFDAGRSCLARPCDMAGAIINIMQSAMEHCGFQYDGVDVIAVRERIPHNRKKTACIYGGLPFRTEYRVFYDFDSRETIFVHDYWDKDYVYPHLYDRTDKAVFDVCYPEIRARYENGKDAAAARVSEAMANVQGLSGPWSIDLMEDEDGQPWLIDMALATMSAYWEYRPGHEVPAPGTHGDAIETIPVKE